MATSGLPVEMRSLEQWLDHVDIVFVIGACVILIVGMKLLRWGGQLSVALMLIVATSLITKTPVTDGVWPPATYAAGAALAGLALAALFEPVTRAGMLLVLLILAAAVGPVLAEWLHVQPRTLAVALLMSGIFWPAGAVALITAAVLAAAVPVQGPGGAALLVIASAIVAALLHGSSTQRKRLG